MAGSAPDYAVDAFRMAIEARNAGPEGSAAAGLVDGDGTASVTLPALTFKFRAPNFLSPAARWVLFVILAGVAVLAILAAWSMVLQTADTDGGEWALPPIFALVVAGFTIAMAYATVMGFGEVDLSSTIGSSEGTAATGLTVKDRVPAPDATDVGADVQVEITFSAKLDPTTVTAASVVLKQGAGGAVVATAAPALESDDTVVRLVPTAALEAATTYEVTVDAALKGADGSALAEPVTWTFTTSA